MINLAVGIVNLVMIGFCVDRFYDNDKTIQYYTEKDRIQLMGQEWCSQQVKTFTCFKWGFVLLAVGNAVESVVNLWIWWLG